MHNRWYGVRIRAARNFFPSFSVWIHLKFMWISFNKWAMSYTDQFLFSSWKRNDGSENVEKVQKRSNHVVLIRFTCSSWQNQQEKGEKIKRNQMGEYRRRYQKEWKRRKKHTHSDLYSFGFGRKSFNFCTGSTKLINQGWKVHTHTKYNEKLLSSSMSLSWWRERRRRWIALLQCSLKDEWMDVWGERRAWKILWYKTKITKMKIRWRKISLK